jgi:hypothetical protein
MQESEVKSSAVCMSNGSRWKKRVRRIDFVNIIDSGLDFYFIHPCTFGKELIRSLGASPHRPSGREAKKNVYCSNAVSAISGWIRRGPGQKRLGQPRKQESCLGRVWRPPRERTYHRPSASLTEVAGHINFTVFSCSGPAAAARDCFSCQKDQFDCTNTHTVSMKSVLE